MKTLGNYLVVFFACVGGYAQKIPVSPAPSWVKVIPYSMEVSDTTNTSGGYYDLLYEEQNNLKTREAYYHYAQKILSEKGLETNSSISETYDPTFQTLTFHSIVIHRNGERINKLATNEFQVLRREENLDRLIYDGSLSAIYNVTDLQVGDVLEYSFTYKGWNPAFGNNFIGSFRLNYGVPVGKLYERIIAEPNRYLNFSYENQAQQPVVSEAGGNKYYEWSLEKVPALQYEDGTSSWFEPYNRVDISSFKSWEEVAQWAHRLYASSPVSSPALDAKITDLKKISNKEEMLRACIEFVQDEVRYLSFSEGIHGYKPHPASKVFEQRFGDCKDKSVLLSYMINRLGFASSAVLVHASKGRKLNEKIPSPIQFNHCIANFVYNDSTYWVDPTMSLQRGPLKKRNFPNYHFGLAILESEKGLTVIPEYKGISKIEYEETFDVAEVGTSAKLHVKTTYYGDEANSIRDQFKANSLATQSKNYLNFYANDYPEIKSVNAIKYSDNQKENVFVTEEEYSIDPFWQYDSAQSKYSVEIYPRSIGSYLTKPSTKIRTMPYGIAYPLNISQRTILNMPEEWTATDTEKSIRSAGFNFTKSYFLKEDKRTIHLNHSYTVTKPFLEASEIKDHVAKVNEIYDNLSFVLTFVKSNGEAKNTPSPYYLIGAVCLIGFVIALRKLNRFDPEAKPSNEQHSQIGGWLILPAIGLVITPISITWDFLNTPFFDIVQWRMLADTNYAGYNLPLGLFVLFEFVINIALLCYSIFLVSIYITRRTSLPLLLIIFYASNVFVQLGDSAAAEFFALDVDKSGAKELIRAILGAAIWIPYFLRSERVKGTFITRY